jgi:hypothetical protein
MKTVQQKIDDAVIYYIRSTTGLSAGELVMLVRQLFEIGKSDLPEEEKELKAVRLLLGSQAIRVDLKRKTVLPIEEFKS